LQRIAQGMKDPSRCPVFTFLLCIEGKDRNVLAFQILFLNKKIISIDESGFIKKETS
jgi:hypothetical protein